MNAIILREPKTCSCGIRHIAATPNAKRCSANHLWFDCSCGSTMFQMSDEAYQARKERRASSKAREMAVAAAMQEIKAVLLCHDVSASVIVCSGEHSESYNWLGAPKLEKSETVNMLNKMGDELESQWEAISELRERNKMQGDTL